jgi:hypothetical protein
MKTNTLIIITWNVLIVYLIISGHNDLKKISQASIGNTATRATVTAYSSETRQTDSTPFITAFMKPVAPGTVAVSWGLAEQGWTEGKCIWIETIGVRRIDGKMLLPEFWIRDLMSRDHVNDKIDIWFHSTKDAFEFGIKPDLLIILLSECGRV